MLGIDFAMHGLAVFSDGTKADYPMFYRSTETKLSREQRKLSKCQKGSNNYSKQKKKLARVHDKIRNQRNDFQHKLSHRLVEEYDVIAVEDLNMKGMSQALHFGKSTMDNGYGAFLSKLEYKLDRRGKIIEDFFVVFVLFYADSNNRRPSLQIFIAAFISLSILFPHEQLYILSESFRSSFIFPQQLHRLLDG